MVYHVCMYKIMPRIFEFVVLLFDYVLFIAKM